MSQWIYKILGGVIALVISLAFMPILQDAIDGLTGVGMAYEGTTTGALLDMLPTILVIVLVLLTVGLIPKKA